MITKVEGVFFLMLYQIKFQVLYDNSTPVLGFLVLKKPFFFFFDHAWWILVPQPGLECTAPAVEAQSLHCWTPGKSLGRRSPQSAF